MRYDLSNYYCSYYKSLSKTLCNDKLLFISLDFQIVQEFKSSLKIYLQRQDGEESNTLGLVSDADSIRENIVDEFTCDGRVYGYYADVANDCQLFHVCYPVQYPDGQEEMIKWSFICPNQTIFDQVCISANYNPFSASSASVLIKV